jgi:hypothetical protein
MKVTGGCCCIWPRRWQIGNINRGASPAAFPHSLKVRRPVRTSLPDYVIV